MISFKQFLMVESALGAHSEYVGGAAEKTMVHAIINQLFCGQKTEQNYDRVYTFIEPPTMKDFYEKYYDAFKEKSEKGLEASRTGIKADLSPETGKLLSEFKKELQVLWKQFKDSRKVSESKELHSGTKNGSRAYKDYTNFKGVSAEEKRELKKEMDRELKKFKDSDHKDSDSYPQIKGKTDWPADKKYREKLKKRGKKIPKSASTTAYQRMYGDKK